MLSDRKKKVGEGLKSFQCEVVLTITINPSTRSNNMVIKYLPPDQGNKAHI